jgi:hypothetical protein
MAKDTKNINSDDMENSRDKTETPDNEINVEFIETGNWLIF